MTSQSEAIRVFCPLGLCGGHCTVFSFYRSKPYLQPYLKAALYPKYGVQGTYLIAAGEDA